MSDEQEHTEAKKRETKSYMTLYTGLQSRVDTALLLLGNVTCDKASTQLLDAVKNLLKGAS